MLSKMIEVKTHLPLDQGIRQLVLFPMLFPKCRLAYLRISGSKMREALRCAAKKALLLE
jgi:hypothetical protein